MFLSRILFNRVKSPLLVRLNELKNDDLSRFFTNDERQRFFQLKQTVGGEFLSIDQIKQLPIDRESFLLLLEDLWAF